VVNAYLIAFGGLLLLAGRLGDLISRRGVFLAGLAVFTLASLLYGVAQSQELLIGARFVQGVGARAWPRGTAAAPALTGGYALAFWIGAALVAASIVVALVVLQPERQKDDAVGVEPASTGSEAALCEAAGAGRVGTDSRPALDSNSPLDRVG
jgi:MFS family permease